MSVNLELENITVSQTEQKLKYGFKYNFEGNSRKIVNGSGLEKHLSYS